MTRQLMNVVAVGVGVLVVASQTLRSLSFLEIQIWQIAVTQDLDHQAGFLPEIARISSSDDSNATIATLTLTKNTVPHQVKPPNIPTNDAFKSEEEPAPTFSACLIFKDDTQLLPEWLAYHYTVLPLRRLVVAMDPFSITDPRFILDEYRKFGINITLWTDEDYLPQHEDSRHRLWSRPVYTANQDGTKPLTDKNKYVAHKWRQKVFVRACLRQMHTEHRTWVLFSDTDEFLSYRWYSNDEALVACQSHRKIRRLGFKDQQDCFQNWKLTIQEKEPRRFSLPPTLSDGTISQYLEQQAGNSSESPRVCFIAPILPVSPTENPSALLTPNGFQQEAFFSYRFVRHGPKYNTIPGKGFVDVSRTTLADYHTSRTHQIMPENFCGNGNAIDRWHALFQFHHYSGPLDFFLRYGDAHRTQEEFERRTKLWIVGNISNTVQSWLPKFVRQVGTRQAKFLTQGLRQRAIDEDQNLVARIRAGHELPKPFYPCPDHVSKYDQAGTA